MWPYFNVPLEGHIRHVWLLTFKERQLYKSGLLNLDLQSPIMSTSSRKTLSKHKAKNCKKSSQTKKFKKTLAQNPSKCKAENLEESSPAKKFKQLYHKICQNAKQRTPRSHRHQKGLKKRYHKICQNVKQRHPRSHRHQRSLKKNFITKSVKMQSRELRGVIAIKEV